MYTQNIFGKNNCFVGKFILTGPLRLDGFLKGEVISDNRLHISTTGKGLGIFSSHVIDIGGVFEGELIASDRVIIRSTAYVKANIRSSFLEMEEGSFFNGICHSNPAGMSHFVASLLQYEQVKKLTDSKICSTTLSTQQ